MACRVPDLQFDLLSVDLDSFNHEVHPDGGPLAWREHSLGKPPDKASLAHSRVTNQDNLQTNVQWWFVVRENYLASRIYIRTNLEQIFVIFHVLLSGPQQNRENSVTMTQVYVVVELESCDVCMM